MYTLVSPCYRCFISTLALIGRAVSEKIFEYYGNRHVHVLYCPGVGSDRPLGSFFFQNHKSSVHLPISDDKFFSSNYILTIFPIQMHG